MTPSWERNAAFRRRVLTGAPVFGTFLSMRSVVSAEVCARAGFDWGLVDLEHGVGAEAAMLPELVALEGAGAAALVRVESGTALRVGRVLDQGAAGVMIPRVRTVAEAAAAVGWARYPPAGSRGVALSVRGADYGEAAAEDVGLINDSITMLIQIENEDALDAVEAIAAVDGVDVLFVGPNDLTHSLGIPGRFDDPRYLAALARVAAAAREAGTAAGVMLRSSDELERHLDLGYRFFALSTDSGLLGRAARTAVGEMRATLGGALGVQPAGGPQVVDVDGRVVLEARVSLVVAGPFAPAGDPRRARGRCRRGPTGRARGACRGRSWCATAIRRRAAARRRLRARPSSGRGSRHGAGPPRRPAAAGRRPTSRC